MMGLFETVRQILKPTTRQCVQCGHVEGTIFCDRYVCRFVEIRPCSECGSGTPCLFKAESCPLALRIERNKRGCKDALAKKG